MVRPRKNRQEELLSAYLDGELSAAEQARLEARLKADPALQAELDHLRRTIALVRQLPSAPLPRNFLLSPEMTAPRPTRKGGLKGRLAAAPRLAFSTLTVGLLFIALLLGDLLTRAPATSDSTTAPRMGFALTEIPAAPPPNATEELPAPAAFSEGPKAEGGEAYDGGPVGTAGTAPGQDQEARGGPAAALPTSTAEETPTLTGAPRPHPRLWWHVAEAILGLTTLILLWRTLWPARPN